MESSGPEGGKVRGPAAMIHERYLQLARDAASSGDRVLSENYLQYADHYFRLWRSTQPATPPPQQANERFEEGADGEEAAGAEMEAGEEGEAAEAGDQPDVEFPQGERPQQFDRDGDQRRRRGRRNRYRPTEGEGGGEQREAREGGEREGGEAREERRERRERQPRERDESAGPEGFSNGPKPAFLRGD
jgi:hypothetical protein